MQVKDIYANYVTANQPVMNEAFSQQLMHFDDRLDELMAICHCLITSKGVFHINIHFSSSQLACWTYDNPYTFQIYNVEDIFAPHFMGLFAPLDSKLHTCIQREDIAPLLETLKNLRASRMGSELRSASIHMMNGYIGLTFACDDTRYIPFRELISPIDDMPARRALTLV